MHKTKSNKDDKDIEHEVKQTLRKEDIKQDHPKRHGKNGNRTLDSLWITFEMFNY